MSGKSRGTAGSRCDTEEEEEEREEKNEGEEEEVGRKEEDSLCLEVGAHERRCQ